MSADHGASGARAPRGVWALLSYAERLHLIHRLTEPAIRGAVRALAPAPGSLGLDAGCGVGTHARLLARAAAPDGLVVGLDLSLQNLAAFSPVGRGLARRCRVDRVNGSLLTLPFSDSCFDWVWSADTLWPSVVAGDPVAAVRELARVVRPGGTVALLHWSGQLLLPGHPGLEARLGACFAEHTPDLAGAPPSRQPLRSLAWLEEAGLGRPRARTLLAEAQAPLAPGLREALLGCFEMLWGDIVGHLRVGDRRAFQRLCSPRSPECILDQPGYHAIVIYTLFAAEVGPGVGRRGASPRRRADRRDPS